MATIKFWQEMQRVVTIDGQDKLMIGKNSTGEAMYVNMEDINQFLSIVGTAVKPIPGGSTEATAVILQPNASGQTREMNNVTGWFKNPTGSAWEAPSTNINMNWWSGTTWSLGSSLPLPTVDTSDFVEKNDIISSSVNMFDKSTMVLNNTLINSSGAIQALVNWRTAKIDITSIPFDTLVSWFGKLGANGPYYAFYNGNTLINFSAYNNTIAKTVTVPANATWLYITIKAPADADTVYNNFMVNVGATVKPFQPYEAFITEIDGKQIAPSSGGGGQAYDQSLNTTDNVKFNSAILGSAEIQGTLRTGTIAVPPTSLTSGEFWLDTTDSISNPILRRKS